jgi:hypothetical protein
MPQKSKARGSASKAGKAGARAREASDAKTQSERFIETARTIGVDERVFSLGLHPMRHSF